MVEKVNGASLPQESLGRNLEFYTIETNEDIRSTASGGNATSQGRLDKLIEIVSTNGQPVIFAAPTANGSTGYIVRLALEHAGAWTNAAVLNTAITTLGAGTFAAHANTKVTISTTLT